MKNKQTTSTEKYFSFSPVFGFETHFSKQSAVDMAEQTIRFYLKDAVDVHAHDKCDIDEVCWGTINQRSSQLTPTVTTQKELRVVQKSTPIYMLQSF